MACAGTALSGQATFLEQFLESAKVLPADVRRQLQLLRVLDFKYQQEFERLKDARKAFLHKVNKLQSGSVDELKELRNMENDLNILSLEKIEAAKALNQIIDAYIQRLDGDMELFKEHFSVEEPEEDSHEMYF